ncbi:MAG TPA: hypothetical protein VIK37_01525 [Candidatus Saccharimonadales bacterium]
MKQKDIALIVFFAVIAAAISFVVAGAIFKPPSGSTKVPVVSAIDPNFPDVKNDSKYSAIFNSQALDPTQPVQIGNQNNTVPFR